MNVGAPDVASRTAMATLHIALVAAVFIALTSVMFVAIGRTPWSMLAELFDAAAGTGYAIGESLLRATPILLCALATIVPARVGLISVGAEGQLYFGALLGSAFVLAWPDASRVVLMPVMVLGGALGGALWAALPALLRVVARVNETISTLLLNYVAALLVTWLVYGPWKDPASQGWPSTIEFPPAARIPLLFDSRLHAGLIVALLLAIVLQFALTRTRWGLTLDVLRSNPRLAPTAQLSLDRQVLLTMLIGGALAGFAGICETSAVQGRLQADLSNGAGLSGFMVAWLCGRRPLLAVPVAIGVGALLAAGDGLQMTTQVPSSITLAVQGLLFVAVLGVGGWLDRGRGGARA